MVKVKATISIEEDIKERSQDLLASKGINFSFFIEQCLKEFIEKEDVQSGNNKEEERV